MSGACRCVCLYRGCVCGAGRGHDAWLGWDCLPLCRLHHHRTCLQPTPGGPPGFLQIHRIRHRIRGGHRKSTLTNTFYTLYRQYYAFLLDSLYVFMSQSLYLRQFIRINVMMRRFVTINDHIISPK